MLQRVVVVEASVLQFVALFAIDVVQLDYPFKLPSIEKGRLFVIWAAMLNDASSIQQEKSQQTAATIVKGQSGKGDQQDRVNVLESVMATEQYQMCRHCRVCIAKLQWVHQDFQVDSLE